MRPTSTARSLLASLAALIVVAGCVTIAPVGDATSPPSVIPSGAVAVTVPPASGGPQRTKRPRATRAPATATATPTLAPTDTPTATETATDMPTVPPTTGQFTFRLPPIDLSSLPILQPVDPKLDYTATPNYGSANLVPGFVPDPHTVGMTSGGTVDVSYVGSACSGFATSAPDFRVSFGTGSALLRIYFVGTSGDTTLVVNDPFGNFYCVDDSFGTVNPTIDFNNPAGGTYDIWVGSYASSTFVSGTLSITEGSGNHP